MAAKLLILTAAEYDIDEAFAWYERQQTGLGYEFLRAVDARISAIRRDPQMSEIIERNYRRALVRRFPYAIIYVYSDATVTIHAVFHTSQDRAKLRNRLR